MAPSAKLSSCALPRSASTTLLLLFAAALCGACTSERVASYVTRGEVRAKYGSGEETRVVIHHERLPEFEDRDGRRAPMASMSMAFGLARGLADAELVPGSKLRFEFEVRWETSPFLVITRFERLPDSARLELTQDHDGKR